MKILSIETSGDVCGIALSIQKEIVLDYSVKGNNLHDKLCSELIRRALNDFDLKVTELDAVAISAGPGSFTGLRIGASIGKALCFKTNETEVTPKFIAVPTLKAFANNMLEIEDLVNNSKILVATKAQKDTLYYQTFDFKTNSKSEIELELIEKFEEMEFSEYLKIGPYYSSGNSNNYNEHSAKAIAKLAIVMYENEEFENPEKFIPLYLQDFQVKTQKKQLKI